MARDWRDERIEALEALVREQQATIARQQAIIEAQQRTIARLEARVAELEARLGLSSRNSSRPPSTDPPGAPPPAAPKRTGRRSGGQPGHPRHQRTLVPPEQVTRTHMLKPVVCRGCGQPLGGDDPEPHRHQVIELPKVVATVDEYQVCSLRCERCGVRTRATLPEGVPTGQFGPRLQAVISLCSGDYKLSKRGIERLVEDFFGVPISLGSISKLEQSTSEALAAPVAVLAEAIRQAPIVHADETGWYERHGRAWLWVVLTGTMAVFAIRARRAAEVAKELLGEGFAGILHSDRWHAYRWVDVLRRQLCWAHLLRQFRGFIDFGPEGAAVGRALVLLTEVMFHEWHRVRAGELSRADFQSWMDKLRLHVLAWLKEGETCSASKVAGRCREILELEAALWTFAHVEGVEPTNNLGERALRPSVLWRKGSFGTYSPHGSRFVERILTVVTTLRMQKRNVLDYVTEACEASLRHASPPSLLPA